MGIQTVDRTDGSPLTGIPRHRSLNYLFRVLFALALLVPAALLTALPVAAAPATGTSLAATGACKTGVGNAGGEGLICDVTIVNTITANGGSATVKVYECLGSAGDPTDGSRGHACTTTTTHRAAPVTSVTQCDGSINGGGGTLRCSLTITNNFVAANPGMMTTTVNQCIGSGETGTVGLNIKCSPVAAATGAAVTQCNRSANGGSLVGLTCSVTGKMAPSFHITIDQGNGSANGGGALIVSSVTLINNSSAASATLGASARASAAASALRSAGAGRTPPTTSTAGDSSSGNSTPPLFPLMILLAFAGLGLATVVTQRRSIRS